MVGQNLQESEKRGVIAMVIFSENPEDFFLFHALLIAI